MSSQENKKRKSLLAFLSGRDRNGNIDCTNCTDCTDCTNCNKYERGDKIHLYPV